MTEESTPEKHRGANRLFGSGLLSSFLAGIMLLAVLFVVQRHNFLLFHTLVELSSISVAWILFLLVWNTRRFARDDALVVLGIAYLFVGLLDLLHTLSYKEMGVFSDFDAANQATQLWVSARTVEAFGLLLFPFLLGRRVPVLFFMAGYAAATALLLAAIFAWGLFPACYIEGAGLTPFKKYAEYAISLTLAAAMLLLYYRRSRLDRIVACFLMASMSITIAAEATLTLYLKVDGWPNLAGHFLKVASFFLLYLSLIRSGVTRPYEELHQEQANLRETLRLLGLFNEKADLKELMRAVLHFMKELSGCEAVGIRLREGDDFPYFETQGFSSEFVDRGTRLCIEDPDRQVLRDDVGRPVLECMCGDVLLGRFDPSKSFFTEGGSFIANSISEFLRGAAGQGCQAHTRNRCNAEGYQSIALIPLRTKGQTFGLMQFNDPKANRFSSRFVALAERLADNVAIALAQRQAEEMSRRYECVVAASKDMMALVDTEFRYLAANKAYAEAFGVSPEAIIGRRVSEVFGQQVFEDMIRPRAEACLRGDDILYEGWFTFPSTGRRYMSAVYSPYVNTAGQITAYTASGRDITERKTAEEALRQSRALEEATIECSPVALYSIDLDGNVQHWNTSAEKTFGWAAAEVIGKPLPIVPEDKMEEHAAFCVQWGHGEGIAGREVVRLRKDGTRFLGLLSAAPLRDASGNVIGTIGAMEDITERKQAEEELERLMSAIDQADEVVVITDTEATIQYVNPAFEAVTGYASYEAVGQNPRVLKSGIQDAQFYQNMWKTLTNGETWRGRMVNKRKDSSFFTEDAVISPVFDDSGRLVNYVAVKHDVTAKIRLEEQLRQAQKMEAMGTLAGGIAHDFNNILGAMMGYTEIISEEARQGRIPDVQSIDEILRAGDRAKDLVGQILAFSRQTDQSKMAVNLGRLVREALRLLRGALPSTITIEQFVVLDDTTIMANPTQMHQIIMNLCTNAWQAMGNENGVLGIQVQSTTLGPDEAALFPGSAPGKYVRMLVSDTGCGMTEETRLRILDPFFTTKKQGEGTGLGLSVVHGIVRDHGGGITIESTPGEGSTFTILLPAIADQEEVVEQDASDLPRGMEHILLVDDEEKLRNIFGQVLLSLGYMVTVCSDGRNAWETFLEEPSAFDLLLTDLTMPRMNGLELATKIHAARSEMPILLCTGYREDLSSDALRAAGILKILDKPVLRRTLALELRRVMDESR